MSARRTDVLEVVARYAAGYFPLYDPWDRFYWERLPIRAMIQVDAAAVRKARKLGARGRNRFEIRYTSAVPEVIGRLQQEKVKENSWVKEEVVRIYGALAGVGLLQTVEAWRGGKLAGAVLGLVLPGTFVAETMFGLEAEASKVCLCRLVEDCAAQGFEMVDVQTPHNLDEFGMPRPAGVDAHGGTAHPCMRLGEVTVSLRAYMTLFITAWRRAFEGDVAGWIREGQAFARGEATEMARYLRHTRGG